jgi:Zn-dependent protease
MFRKGIRLPFNLAGIPLYLDYSFLLILPLMVWATAGNLGRFATHLGLDRLQGPAALALGLFAVLGLFASVVLHELGHSLTARRYGVNVRRITLWFLGGVAEFEEMPRQRGAEAVVAIAGPIVSFALAGLFWVASMFVQGVPAAWLICFYLTAVNLMLGLFNLIPAMPLDGGRILRSLLALRMPYARATAIAGNVAIALAILLGVWGLTSFNGWTMVLAFFIFNAARNETRQSLIVESLRGLRVGDVMNRLFPGMLPTANVVTIRQDAPAVDAITLMARQHVGQLVVVDDVGQSVGVISMSDLLHAIDARSTQYQRVQSAPGTIRITRLDLDPPAAHPAYPPSERVGYTPPHADRDPQRYARQV